MHFWVHFKSYKFIQICPGVLMSSSKPTLHSVSRSADHFLHSGPFLSHTLYHMRQLLYHFIHCLIFRPLPLIFLTHLWCLLFFMSPSPPLPSLTCCCFVLCLLGWALTRCTAAQLGVSTWTGGGGGRLCWVDLCKVRCVAKGLTLSKLDRWRASE